MLECNVAVTKLSNAIVPTLKKLFLASFAFDKVPEFLFLVRDYCICVIIREIKIAITANAKRNIQVEKFST